MIDCLVERVGTHADRGPAQIVLAEIDRVQRRIPCFPATRENVGVSDWVIVQRVLSDEVLRVTYIFYALVILVPWVDDEENVIVAAIDLAEGRDQARFVGIANVVLATACEVAAVVLREERHLRRIDISAVLLFGQAERENVTVA